MTDLSKLPPAALKAAMQGGTASWGQWGSAEDHVRYAVPMPARGARYSRKCRCGCGGWATKSGMANGVGLMHGCDLHVARWIRNPADAYRRPRPLK